MKKLYAILAIASSSLYAQSTGTDSSGYTYEERPGVGLYYELGRSLKNVNYEYTIANKPFRLDWEAGPYMGVGAHLPISSWIGINGVIAIQQIKFKYAMKDLNDSTSCYYSDCEDWKSDYADTTNLYSFEKGLSMDDLVGEMKSRNLLIQASFEFGVPVFSSYKHQMLLKPLAYIGGILGKTFFDDSKYTNANLWGYAYGGGLRLAWGPIALESGVRLSHVYWRTYFDPADQTGEQAMDDTFLFDYDTPVSPYFKAVWSLY